jgi:hypothetical protein
MKTVRIDIEESGLPDFYHFTSPDMHGLFVSGDLAEIREAVPVMYDALVEINGGTPEPVEFDFCGPVKPEPHSATP